MLQYGPEDVTRIEKGDAQTKVLCEQTGGITQPQRGMFFSWEASHPDPVIRTVRRASRQRPSGSRPGFQDSPPPFVRRRCRLGPASYDAPHGKGPSCLPQGLITRPVRAGGEGGASAPSGHAQRSGRWAGRSVFGPRSRPPAPNPTTEQNPQAGGQAAGRKQILECGGGALETQTHPRPWLPFLRPFQRPNPLSDLPPSRPPDRHLRPPSLVAQRSATSQPGSLARPPRRSPLSGRFTRPA